MMEKKEDSSKLGRCSSGNPFPLKHPRPENDGAAELADKEFPRATPEASLGEGVSSASSKSARLSEPRSSLEKEAIGAGNRQLVKAAGVVGLMTLASRFLGMIRDILSAKKFGTSWQWDAFIFAFMVPNLLRRLVGEGALASAFIPVYSEALQKEGRDQAFRFANLVVTIGGTILLALTLLFELIVQALLHDSGLPERVRLVLSLLQIFSPYLCLLSLYAVGMGILNCHEKFFAASLGPVIMDLFWIAGVLWLIPQSHLTISTQLHFLAVVVLLSGGAQCAAQIPSLMKLRYRFTLIFDWNNSFLKKSWTLLLPSLLSFGMIQMNLLIDQTMAMAMDPGANSSLWYGTRLMQFPLGLFTMALGTALLPAVSHQVAAGDKAGAQKSIAFALRSIFWIILPCTAGLMVLSRPIIEMLFQRGAFDAVSTARTASVMFYYSAGLFVFSGQKILTTSFYAEQDTRTPVVAGVICLIANLFFNIVLMGPMKEAGLALSTTLAGLIQFVWLARSFIKKNPDFDLRPIMQSTLRTLGASLGMAIFCLYFFGMTEGIFSAEGWMTTFLRVMLSIAVSVVVYLGLCWMLRVTEMKEAMAWIFAKRSSKK